MIRFHERRAQCDSDEYAQEEIVLKYTASLHQLQMSRGFRN